MTGGKVFKKKYDMRVNNSLTINQKEDTIKILEPLNI